MKIAIASLALPKAGALALTVAADGTFGPFGADLDARTGGILSRAIAAGRFTGKPDETLTVLVPTGVEVGRIVLVGIGKPAEATAATASGAAAAVVAGLLTSGETELAIAADTFDGLGVEPATFAAEMAFGAVARGWRFDRYKTKTPEEKKPTLKKVTILTDAKGAKKAWDKLEKVADGVFLTREVVAEPPNVLYPETFAERCA
ncbi:MAG: putative leucyl aminopeptidase PepA, partial [Pseudomonadota bacterium]